MNRVAYCYLTDLKNDLDMFAWSEASLRHHCGDVDVFVCTAGRREGAVDISGTFREVYGKDVDPLAKCRGNGKFPLLVFGKFILGMCPEFASYDRVVAMDGDIEVFDGRFAGLGQLPFPDDADVGLHLGVAGPAHRLWSGTPAPFANLWYGARVPYSNTGLVVCRPGWRAGFVDALRGALAASERYRLFLPEEHAALVYLRRWFFPREFHQIVPKDVVRDGRELEYAKVAYAVHYAGPLRKKWVRDRWRRRAEETYA